MFSRNKIETKEDLDKLDLTNNIVFKKSFYGSYCIFNINAFEKSQNQDYLLNSIISSKQDINEVLLYNSPRKIYFDIEKLYESTDEMVAGKEFIFNNFENDIKKYIKSVEEYIDVEDIEILYVDASGYTKEEKKYKLSLHIIVNNYGYFINYNKLFYFINQLDVFTNKKYNDFIDFKVYNEFRLFRTPFSISPKDGEKRRLKIHNKEYKNFWNLFVLDYKRINKKLDYLVKDENIPQQYNIPQKQKSRNFVQQKDIDFIILDKIMNKIGNDFYVYKIKGNIININRKRASLCEICNITHNSENSYLIFNKDNVSLGCHRNIKKNTKIIYNKKTDLNVNNSYFKLLLIINKLCYKIKHLCKYKNFVKNIIQNINKKDRIEDKTNKIKNNIPQIKPSTELKFNKYYELGKNIINKKDTLYNLATDFCNEKNIYKLKSRAIRCVEFLDTLKRYNINNINISLRFLFHMKKIEFIEYIKNIPQQHNVPHVF
jgi:hypothetical protein